MEYVVPPVPPASVPVKGSDARFPVHRIYCVGRNYAAHAREMGKDPDRDPPFFFCKPADAVVENNATIPYPPRTENFHFEAELVVAIGKAGVNVPEGSAKDLIFGYAVGNDLTRRDLQLQAREQGRPWDTGKAFDLSAPVTAIHPIGETGELTSGKIQLTVNGEVKQDADLKELIWDVNEIITELSTLFGLVPGDLIFTGTPAGVGPVKPGDEMVVTIEGLDPLVTRIAA